MKSVLLIGLGRFGRNMAQKLSELHYEVMAVDKEENLVNAVLPLVTDAQIGDVTNEAFLETLGVDNFDLCFVTIGADFQSSLVATALLKDLGAKRVVARASSEIHKKFLLRNGADDVFYPAKQVADWAVIRYAVDHVLDYVTLDSEYAIYDVAVPEEWDGKTVGSLDIRKKYGLNVLAVRGGGATNAAITSETVLLSTQTVLVLGHWKDVQKCFRI
ncbi:MAG: TrkA family potassium uptake protein [Clostridia bacterium]|nr:TrkA family potassium uptake protein [Clostridia bacterium]